MVPRLMPTYGYKTSDGRGRAAGPSRFDVLKLANQGFVCRSAFSGGRWVSSIRDVKVGDRLQWWHREGGIHRVCGAYVWEVVGPEGHPLESFVGEPVEGTALYTLKDSTFVRELGYEPDPQLGEYTGWLIRPTTERMPPWDKNHPQLPGQRTLTQLFKTTRGKYAPLET